MSKPRIIFAGSPEFSVKTLNALSAVSEIVAVYTQPDRPAGRGRKPTPCPVKQAAQTLGLPVRQPPSLKKDRDAVAELAALRADLMVVVAYGLLLPQSVLDAPRLGCINVHASLLPRWRGAAPIQRAIAAGDSETGVTIMGMELGLDTGPMYLKKRLEIAADDTGGSLHDKLAPLGAQAMLEALPGILDASLEPEPQDDTLSNYARKLSKDEAAIDWSRPAQQIERLVRAFNPWPVAQTRLDEAPLRIWEAGLGNADASTSPPGHVIATGKDGIQVATGEGSLRITRLQPPGKKAMTAHDYLNAHNLHGAIFV